jgi:hypothetical protein
MEKNQSGFQPVFASAINQYLALVNMVMNLQVPHKMLGSS